MLPKTLVLTQLGELASLTYSNEEPRRTVSCRGDTRLPSGAVERTWVEVTVVPLAYVAQRLAERGHSLLLTESFSAPDVRAIRKIVEEWNQKVSGIRFEEPLYSSAVFGVENGFAWTTAAMVLGQHRVMTGLCGSKADADRVVAALHELETRWVRDLQHVEEINAAAAAEEEMRSAAKTTELQEGSGDDAESSGAAEQSAGAELVVILTDANRSHAEELKLTGWVHSFNTWTRFYIKDGRPTMQIAAQASLRAGYIVDWHIRSYSGQKLEHGGIELELIQQTREEREEAIAMALNQIDGVLVRQGVVK